MFKRFFIDQDQAEQCKIRKRALQMMKESGSYKQLKGKDSRGKRTKDSRATTLIKFDIAQACKTIGPGKYTRIFGDSRTPYNLKNLYKLQRKTFQRFLPSEYKMLLKPRTTNGRAQNAGQSRRIPNVATNMIPFERKRNFEMERERKRKSELESLEREQQAVRSAFVRKYQNENERTQREQQANANANATRTKRTVQFGQNNKIIGNVGTNSQNNGNRNEIRRQLQINLNNLNQQETNARANLDRVEKLRAFKLEDFERIMKRYPNWNPNANPNANPPPRSNANPNLTQPKTNNKKATQPQTNNKQAGKGMFNGVVTKGKGYLSYIGTALDTFREGLQIEDTLLTIDQSKEKSPEKSPKMANSIKKPALKPAIRSTARPANRSYVEEKQREMREKTRMNQAQIPNDPKPPEKSAKKSSKTSPQTPNSDYKSANDMPFGFKRTAAYRGLRKSGRKRGVDIINLKI